MHWVSSLVIIIWSMRRRFGVWHLSEMCRGGGVHTPGKITMRMRENGTCEDNNKYDKMIEGNTGNDGHETYIREARRKIDTKSRLIIVEHLVFKCLPRLSGEQTRTISDKSIRILMTSAQFSSQTFERLTATLYNVISFPPSVVVPQQSSTNTQFQPALYPSTKVPRTH